MDDVEAFRLGVRTMIAGRNGWDVCGEASNGVEAIAKVQELRSDVIIILDVSMPKMNGLQATTEIRKIAPLTKLVLFTAYSPSLICRADACVSKTGQAQELISTLERVAP